MEITLIIVGGIVLTTLIAAVADSFTKARVAKASQDSTAVQDLTRRIAALEAQLAAQDSKILLLEESAAFTTRLLEDKGTKL